VGRILQLRKAINVHYAKEYQTKSRQSSFAMYRSHEETVLEVAQYVNRYNYVMAECWAKSIGNCSDKLSREHLVSEGVFPDQMLIVQGWRWCKNEPREISINGLASKILCKSHNSLLSDVDRAGIDAMNVFREADKVRKARAAIQRPMRWRIKTFTIDGSGLERWCLKTLINAMTEDEYKIGKDSEAIGKPSARLVRIAFGQERFKVKAGLYGIGAVGAEWNLIDGFRLLPYIDSERTLVAGLFSIHGYQFFAASRRGGFRCERLGPRPLPRRRIPASSHPVPN
jgi:hypothetical protein